MRYPVDLHTHSTASDGTLSPTLLVQEAHRAGIAMLALTDHDTTSGIEAASKEAKALGLRLIPGVEISVTWEGRTLHILGLHIDILNPVLQKGLERLQAYRKERAAAIGEALGRHGIPGALEGALDLTPGDLVSRTHFARFLVEAGYARNLKEVFRHFLVKGKPGHVEGHWASLEEALAWIHGAGGMAVIAHPLRYRLGTGRIKELFKVFKAAGGDGVEVISGYQQASQTSLLARHAATYGLLASQGSDYHGPEYPGSGLGGLSPLPEVSQPIWEAW